MVKGNRRSGGFGKVLLGLLLGVLICAGGLFVLWQFQPQIFTFNGKTSIDLQVLKESLKKNNELSTSKYLYTSEEAVVDQNTLAIIGHPEITLPFTDAVYIFHFDGIIKAGFDLNEAQVTKSSENKVTVTLPAPKILSDEIGNIEVTYKMENILNPLQIGEETEWVNSQKAAMEKKAIDQGLYDEARENAKTTITNLLAPALPNGCEIEFIFK